MKLSSFFISVVIITSCSLSRYTKDNFIGKDFSWGESPSMLGKSSIKFIDDTSFVYSERDSLFICSGTWYLSPDRKTITIKGADIPLKNNLNPPITVKMDKVFRIISATKIRDDDFKIFLTER